MNHAACYLGTSCSLYDKRNSLFLGLHEAQVELREDHFSQGGIFRRELS